MQRAVEEDDADFVREKIAQGVASPNTVLMHLRNTPSIAELAIERGSLRVLSFLLASRVGLSGDAAEKMFESLARSRNPGGVLRTFADSTHPERIAFIKNIPVRILGSIVLDDETFEHIREKTGVLVVTQFRRVDTRDERDGETKTGLTLVTFSSLAHEFI